MGFLGYCPPPLLSSSGLKGFMRSEFTANFLSSWRLKVERSITSAQLNFGRDSAFVDLLRTVGQLGRAQLLFFISGLADTDTVQVTGVGFDAVIVCIGAREWINGFPVWGWALQRFFSS